MHKNQIFWSYLLECFNKLCSSPCEPWPHDCCSLQPKKWHPYHSHIASHVQVFLKHKNTVFYHLHGESGSSTVCANGKQSCLMASPVQIVLLPFTPFTQKTSICGKRPGGVAPDHNSKMAMKVMVGTFSTLTSRHKLSLLEGPRRIWWYITFVKPFSTNLP